MSAVTNCGPTKKKKMEGRKKNFPTYKLVLGFHYRSYVFEAFPLLSTSRNTHKMYIEE